MRGVDGSIIHSTFFGREISSPIGICGGSTIYFAYKRLLTGNLEVGAVSGSDLSTVFSPVSCYATVGDVLNVATIVEPAMPASRSSCARSSECPVTRVRSCSRCVTAARGMLQNL